MYTKFYVLEVREDFRGRIFFRGPDMSFWLDFQGFQKIDLETKICLAACPLKEAK
jgi:hypothetical protein